MLNKLNSMQPLMYISDQIVSIILTLLAKHKSELFIKEC